MSMMVSFVLSFFPRDVLDEILNLIESVSEDFPSYSFRYMDPLNFNFYRIIEDNVLKTYMTFLHGKFCCYGNHS